MGFPYTFWSEIKSKQSKKGVMSVFLPRYLIFYSNEIRGFIWVFLTNPNLKDLIGFPLIIPYFNNRKLYILSIAASGKTVMSTLNCKGNNGNSGIWSLYVFSL